ncbi:replicative DNA helicase [bacterium]|nr:replicative DNA helicase [bacterium]MCI0604627.1 replicative DNA helicase [bacterium]
MSVDLITERGLPHSLDAERCVLGSIILENDSIYQVLDLLSGEDFYAETHRILYDRFVELVTKSRGVDLIILKEELSRLGELEQVGGITYVASLIDAVPTARNISHYAQIIKERAALRRLILAGYEIIDSCYKQEEETEEILNKAEQKIFAIAENRLTTGFSALKDLADSAWTRINYLHENPGVLTGLPTGFVDFDNMTSGLQPGDLIVIAGRPSMGKTAFALNIAQHVARVRKTVGIFSLEMSKEQLMLRFICSEAQVNAHRLRSGECTREEWSRLMKAMAVLTEASIYVDDSSGLTPLDMGAKSRRLKAEHGCDLLIVDYMQMMRMKGRYDNRQQEITAISRSLKELAKELNLPVVALSQLHRGPETRGKDHKPMLSDLRESGAIEQDADLVCFIYREEVYDATEENRGLAEILVRKQRNGPIGDIPLVFLKEWTRFVDKYQ